MVLQDLMVAIKQITLENCFSDGMAVPKKRRSKAKGKTRLSNWKKKGEKAATKAYSAAKTFFAKEKAAASLKELNDKDNEGQIEEKVVNSNDSAIDMDD